MISPVDTHAFKRSLHHSERYNRRGFGRAEEVAGSRRIHGHTYIAQITLAGQPVAFSNPQDAMRAGITAVHQETVMFDELTVAENIYVGRQPVRGARIDWKLIEAEAEKLFARLEVSLPVRARVKDLSVAQRHFVEIARALSQDARVVIMDEPTAALGVKEGNMVLELIRRVRDKGLPVILISHNMPHVWEVSDRIQIQRLGGCAGVITPEQRAGVIYWTQDFGRPPQ